MNAKPFERQRQLAAVYWKPILSAISLAVAGLPGALKLLKDLGVSVGEFPELLLKNWWFPISVGVVVFLLFRFPRVAALVTRIILGPPPPLADTARVFRGLRAYGSGERLPQRD